MVFFQVSAYLNSKLGVRNGSISACISVGSRIFYKVVIPDNRITPLKRFKRLCDKIYQKSSERGDDFFMGNETGICIHETRLPHIITISHFHVHSTSKLVHKFQIWYGRANGRMHIPEHISPASIKHRWQIWHSRIDKSDFVVLRGSTNIFGQVIERKKYTPYIPTCHCCRYSWLISEEKFMKSHWNIRSPTRKILSSYGNTYKFFVPKRKVTISKDILRQAIQYKTIKKKNSEKLTTLWEKQRIDERKTPHRKLMTEQR